MAAVAALLSLCFGALTSCPSDAGPHCIAELARGIGTDPKCVAVSHDDTLAAVVAVFEGLYVYNVNTGDALTVPRYVGTWSVAFSPDADKVVVCAQWGEVAVASLTNGTELWSGASKGECFAVAYSRDGARVASGNGRGGVYIWNAATGELELNLTQGHTEEVTSLVYTPDGGRLLSASADRVVVWDATTGDVLKRIPLARSRKRRPMQVSPDGLYFGTLGWFGSQVTLYKLSDYSLYKKLSGAWGMTGLSFSQDSRKLVVVAYEATEVFSVETGSLLEQHLHGSKAVAYFHTSDTIVMAGGSGTVVLWADGATVAPPTTTAPATAAPPPTPAPLRAPCPSGAGPECISELGRVDYPRSIAVSNDDTLAAVGTMFSSRIYVYNVTTGTALTVPSYDARGAAFSPDAENMAVAVSHKVAVISLTDGTELWWDTSVGPCNAVAYSPDGTRLASGHFYGSLYIWDAATGELVLRLPPSGSETWDSSAALSYTPDGGRLVVSSSAKVVVRNATTLALLNTVVESEGTIATQVSPDGRYFAILTGRWGYPVYTYPVRIYKLSDYSLHKGIAKGRFTTSLAFSSDSSKLVVVGYRWEQGDREVYSVETGSLLESHAMPSPTAAVAYFHNSDTIITAGKSESNSSILLWDGLATPSPPTPSPPTPAPATPAPPTVAPPPGLPPTRICTEDDACRVFGDATANCNSSQHCACGTHSGPLCEIPVAGPAPVDVKMIVAVKLWVGTCVRAGLHDLLETLHAAAAARGAQSVSVGASCGTLSVVAVSGVVPGATISATAAALIDALGAAAVAHSNLTKVTYASQLNPFVQTAQTSGRNATPVCTQGALNTVQTYDGRCLVLSCQDGFALSVDTRDGKDYHTCTTTAVDTPVPRPVSTPAPIPDAEDDGLSAGAIAGIVVGSAVAVAVLVAVLVWCVRRATDSEQQPQQQKQEMSRCVNGDA